MSSPLPQVLAAAVIAVAIWPALDGWFLADDFFLGEQIHAQSRRHPGALAQIRAAATHRWTEEFEVFRPLTILTVQLDYALWGTHGGRHHATNMVLWLVASVLFASLACRVSGHRSPPFHAGAMLLFGLYPAGVESLGWLVAREDLIMAASALLSVLLLVSRPGRPAWWTLALVPAFLAKETAVVLPPLLLWVDVVLVRGAGPRRPAAAWAGRLLRRHAPPFLLLAFYLALRLLLFGTIGTTYNQRPYADYLAEPGSAGRILESVGLSLVRMATPVNQAVWERVVRAPLWLAWLAFLGPLAALLACGVRRRRPGDLRVVLVGLAWVLGPLLLLCPLFHVESTMEESRMLVLPMGGFLLPLGVALHRGVASRSPVALAAGLVLLSSAFATMRLDLDAYRHAGDRARHLVEDITRHFSPGSRVILLGTDDPSVKGGFKSSISICEGAYVLSAGLFHATRPPFVAAPGIHPDVVLRHQRQDLAVIVDLSGEGERPGIACLRDARQEPFFQVLAQPGFYGPPPRLFPAHGSSVPRSWEPVFEAAGHLAPVRGASRVQVKAFEPRGYGAVAQVPWSGEEVTVEGDLFRIRVPGSRFQLWDRDAGRLIPGPFTAEGIRDLPSPVFLWWVEVLDGERLLLRSPYAVVTLR